MFEKNKIAKTVALIVVLVFGAYVGFQVGVERGKTLERSESLPISEDSVLNKDMSLFWEAVEIVKDNYYKPDEIKDKQLLYGSVKGMVNSLEDPYSAFLPPEDAQKFAEDISGSFGGIGAEIGKEDDQLVIISPLEGNPAQKAGLKSGDKIVKINEKLTNDISIEEAVKLIRGEKGTEVTLSIMREGFEKPKEFDITRGTIEIPTLDFKMKDDNIAYMHLFSFNAKASSKFYDASFDALLKGAKGIILDLRNNSGGFLKVANQLSGWFLDRGDLVVKEKFASEEVKEFRAQGNGVWGKFPVVVLVNGGSASASEIVAGALRDQIGATIVGTKTFGKGTVQEVKSLPGGSKLKVTVAEWILPSGNIIEGKGIEPDVKVEPSQGEDDPQLQKALEIIKEKMQKQENSQNKVLPI